ncbi:MAG TPA: HEAT repeat domain-containing protein [Gemmataceae bacterium]|nr:HEAT repeat domain-containing protein [Gemmataceae bacterium]
MSDECPWCRKLEQQIGKSATQAELARWVLVSLDVDRLAKESESLADGPTPALRVLTATGRVVASQDGYMPAAELVAWLKGHYQAAAAQPARELLDGEAPDAEAVARLVGELGGREPALREAAIRRLLPHAAVAAGPVAEALAHGSLQSRLAALELLREWKAPVKDLDPWRPKTLSEARLRAVRAWSARAGAGAAQPPGTLTAAQLASARQEIRRMLQAPEQEAAAIRERLVRYRAAMLPEVSKRLQDAITDRARERLTALRYRLAADDALVLGWPGGVERLASNQAATRRQAAQELATRATAAEEPLLLELFSNPDPLVREISLHGLRGLADPQATPALAKLLHDPEPNVRAAVLKQLAEEPSPRLVPRIVDYVAAEKDSDLVVHAVRVLKATPGAASRECLKGLLRHASWRVRAEAVEGLEKLLHEHRGEPGEREAETCVALIEVLQDQDAFVAGRAVEALKEADLAAAVAPLVRAARSRPEMAAAVVRALAAGSTMRAEAVDPLKEFCHHPDAEVRAAAVEGVCTAAPDDAEPLVRAGLQDRSSDVRRAAAAGLFGIIQSQREGLERRQDQGAVDWEDWLAKFRAGKGRPEWFPRLSGLLRALLAAKEPDERLAGALPLVALGQEEAAVPVLLALAKAEPAVQEKVAEALVWLPWPKRLELFNRLAALGPGPEQLAGMIRLLTRMPDQRAINRLWDLAAHDRLPGEVGAALTDSLDSLHFGTDYASRSRARARVSSSERKKAVAAAARRAGSGPEGQRRVALAVLLAAAPDDAVEAADHVVADPRASARLRRDAFRVQLLGRANAESHQLAMADLTHADPVFRSLAIKFLAMGAGPLQALAGESWHLEVADATVSGDKGASSGEVIVPAAPQGLKAAMVRPLLHDRDPEVAACAGYLLAVLGEPNGLEPLVRYWRAHARQHSSWVRLVYRAVAAGNDDGQVRLLEEIYRGFDRDDGELPEFYWTIRVMDGPNALKLRKTIRHEVGMEQLR